jgi:transposase InsO family protein
MARTHRTAELRSIALHGIVAQRAEEDPEVLDRARARVAEWLTQGGPVDARYARRWEELLARPAEQILTALVADTEEMRDLRQCSPFSGVVTPAERWRVIREVREDGLAGAKG